jgi:hypothetical protein
MKKRIGVIALGLVAALAFSGIVVASTSANPPLGCYQAEREETGGMTGDYGAGCTAKQLC